MNIRGAERILAALGVLAALLIFLAPKARAQSVPPNINFQGRLNNAAGVPINGTVSIVFNIWNAPVGGASLWNETQGSVVVSTGIYNVALGSVVALSSSVFTSPATYLEIKVGADPAMTPRLQLQSVPYAFNAASLGGGSTLLVNGGNVGIGTTNPVSRLDVFGGDLNMESGMGRFKGWFNTGNGPAAEVGYNAATAIFEGYDRTGFNFVPLLIAGSTVQIVGNSGTGGLFVDTAGKVGVGTTSPALLLDVNGGAVVRSSMTYAGALTVDPPAIPGQGAMYYNTTSNELRVLQNGAWMNLGTGSSGGGWTETLPGGVVDQTNPADNIVVQSTLTVQGGAFSVGGSTFVVTGGAASIGTAVPGSTFFSGTLPHVGLEVSGPSHLNNGTPGPNILLQGVGGAGLELGLEFYPSNNLAASILAQDDGSNGGANLLFNTAFGVSAPSTKMMVSSVGNIGIGTTSPALALDVNGGVVFRSTTVWSAIGSPPASSVGQGVIYFDAGQNQFQVSQNGGLYNALVPWSPIGQVLELANPANSVLVQSTMAVQGNAFSVGGSTLVVAGGSVGIGTTNPGYKLDVQGGQVNASGGLCIAGACQASWTSFNNGNVGIGAGSDISYTLDITHDVSAVATSLALTNDNSGAGNGHQIALRGNFIGTLWDLADIEAFSDAANTGGVLAFWTARATRTPTEAMRIDSSGNVGIGTSNPTALLHVNGAAYLAGPTSFGGPRIRNTTTQTGTYTMAVLDDVVFADATTGGFTVTLPAGAVTVGREILICKIDSNVANIVNISAGGNTVIGSTTGLNSQGGCFRVIGQTAGQWISY